MKILYLDLGMGAAGDMLTAALLDSMNEKDKAEAIKEISLLGIPDVTFDVEKSVKCGITGTHVSVKVHGIDEAEGLHEHHGHEHDHNSDHGHEHEHDHNSDHGHSHEHDNHEHHHHHSNLQKINDIVDSLKVSEQIKADVKSIYNILAEAEGHVHGKPVTEIHFHEVGTMDAVADITAACILIRKISADKIIASPIHVGSGQVRCAHGILPVPAPATAYILRGIPMYSTDIKGELCTPTGAAILKYFVNEYGAMPAMTSDSIGYGMGYKDFERANCVRVMVGTTQNEAMRFNEETDKDNALHSDGKTAEDRAIHSDEKTAEDRTIHSDEKTARNSSDNNDTDSIIELRCNIDDMTGEEMGFALEQLMEAGARDVFTTPITMKKNRPGILLTVICSTTAKDKMVREIFKNTTTIGIRETICNRYILERTEETLNTPLGQVREKRVTGYGVERSKLEYDDLASIARNTGKSLQEVRNLIK